MRKGEDLKEGDKARRSEGDDEPHNIPLLKRKPAVLGYRRFFTS